MEQSIIDFILKSDETINDEVQADKTYCKASEKASKLYEKLRATLSEEQKDWFDRFLDWEAEQEEVKERKIFACGVKYGVRLVAECMFD